MEISDNLPFRSFDGLTEAVGRGSQELGKNEFLELLTTQLENQDPIEPMENTEFIAQLAQFSSLEGIQNVAASVDGLTASLRGSRIADGASMIGRAALARTDLARVDPDAPVSGLLRLPEGAADVRVEVLGPAGDLLERIALGDLDAGDTGFEWAPTGVDGAPPERVRIRAFAGSDEEAESLPVYLPVGIRGVSLADDGSGELEYRLDSGDLVTATDILELR